jgi:diguanylate cyclase
MVVPFRSLRTTLIVPFALLVVTVAVTVSWFSYSANLRAVDDVSRRLLEDVANRIAQTMAQHLSRSETVLNAVAVPDAVRGGDPLDFSSTAPGATSELERRLWIASGLFPQQNTYVYFASESGRYVGIQRGAMDSAQIFIRADSNEPRRAYHAISPERRGTFLREEIYEPRERPWYKQAVAKRATTWTQPYQDAFTGELKLTLARPLLSSGGEMRGVVATDMSLAQFATFVRTLKVSENGVAFVVEPNGNLVASSFGTGDMSWRDKIRADRSAANSESPFVRDAFGALSALRTTDLPETHTQTHVKHLPFKSSLGRAHLSVIEYRDEAGLDLRLVVAVPRSDHMAPVYRGMIENLAISACAVLLALAFGSWMLHRVAADVTSVSDAAARLVSGRKSNSVIPDRDDEIGALASSVAAIQDVLLFDRLTGALNRDAFYRQFEAVASNLPRDDKLALIFVDLDRFKHVNDRYGHLVGDSVLTKSAERIRRRLRERDLLARFGGDEFVIMIHGKQAVESIDALVERLSERLRLGMMIDGHNVAVGASIGVAIFPDDGKSLDDLIRIADERMYGKKRLRDAVRD